MRVEAKGSGSEFIASEETEEGKQGHGFKTSGNVGNAVSEMDIY